MRLKNKWFPYIALLLAIAFFAWIKYHQRGKGPENKIEINAAQLSYSKHARCRMECRQIDESEVREVLANGKMDNSRTRTTNEGTSYAVEGITHDDQRVRVVYSPHNENTVIVTVIDLDKEWPCNCN